MSTKIFLKLIGSCLILFILLAGFSTGSAMGDEPTLTQSPDEGIEAFVDQFLQERMPQAHVPGLVVVVVKDGNVILSKGYGYADFERQIPMTPQTNLRAGSISKPVLATAVLQLAEQGLVELNAPVSQYINDLNLKDKYGPASTVSQLLTQQGGYTDDILLAHAPTLDQWQPLDEYLANRLPQREIQPGVMSYSSWNYALLGYMIEKVTGASYNQAIAQNLFQPVGMEMTTYTQPLPKEFLNNLANGYYYHNGEYQIIPLDFVNLSPGVALVTNGEDMGRFMQLLLSDGMFDGRQVLRKETVEALLTRQTSAHPNSRGRTYAFAENKFNGRMVLYHSGNGIGFTSEIVLIPEHGLGVFVSVNHRFVGRDLFDWTPAGAIVRELDSAIVEKFVPESPSDTPLLDPLPDATKRTQRYVGHYQTADASMHNFTQIAAIMNYVDVWANADGTITATGTPLVEVEPLVFQDQKYPNSFVVFTENANGEVEYLTFGGTASYRKSAWFETLNFTAGLVGVATLIFLSFLLTWPFLHQGHWLAWAVSLLNSVFLVGLTILLTTGDFLILFKTIPLSWQIVLILPWFSLVAAVGLIVTVYSQWKVHTLPLWCKIHTSLVGIASIAFLWFVHQWNLFLK